VTVRDDREGIENDQHDVDAASALLVVWDVDPIHDHDEFVDRRDRGCDRRMDRSSRSSVVVPAQRPTASLWRRRMTRTASIAESSHSWSTARTWTLFG
jgi:hypothetical protein